MEHIFMQHQVADYDVWRPIFDADSSNRATAGVTDIAVLRDVADPNSIWTVYDADPALIEPMMSDPTRAEQMQAAGVISEPQVGVA